MLTQLEMEQRYSNTFTKDIYREAVEVRTKQLIKPAVKMLSNYLSEFTQKDYEYTTKKGEAKVRHDLIEAHKCLKELDVEKTLITLYSYLWQQQGEDVKLPSLLGLMDSDLLKYDWGEYPSRRFEVANTLLMVLSHCEGIHSIVKDRKQTYMYCQLELTEEMEVANQERCYPLPLITLPNWVDSNINNGYYLIKQHVLLGSRFNRHDKRQRYSHLNTQNGVQYEYEPRLEGLCKPTFSNEPKIKKDGQWETDKDIAERRKSFDHIMGELPKRLQIMVDKVYYLVHGYDTRGRFYPKAYEYNYQGMKYLRCMQRYHIKEVVAPEWHAKNTVPTPAQWVLMDLASQYGMDKDTFKDRLKFGQELLPMIEGGEDMKAWIDKAKEPECFALRILTIKDIIAGDPVSHPVGLDAASSGPQLLSVMTRCYEGMMNTGAILNGVPWLYNKIYELMDNVGDLTIKQVKKATVPYVYGSEDIPNSVFGDDALAFTLAYATAVPGAARIREILLCAWNSEAKAHEWELPDGHIAYVPVIATHEYSKCPYDEGHYKYIWRTNQPVQRGMSLVANVTHSFDSYVARELSERCNYNRKVLLEVKRTILDHFKHGSTEQWDHLLHLQSLAQRYQQVSIEACQHMYPNKLKGCDPTYLNQLLTLIDSCLVRKPFSVRIVHDEFQSLPNHTLEMKQVYNDILAESYEGDWLFSVLDDLTGMDHRGMRPDVNPDISREIRDNLYAIH